VAVTKVYDASWGFLKRKIDAKIARGEPLDEKTLLELTEVLEKSSMSPESVRVHLDTYKWDVVAGPAANSRVVVLGPLQKATVVENLDDWETLYDSDNGYPPPSSAD
jgi:hypothetical protein